MKNETSKLITAIAYRARRNTTGYYTGYMGERQPVGAFELKQAVQNLQYLEVKLKGKSNAAQYHNMANRMLGDLEFRGHDRPMSEEVNLAANGHPHDVANAEFFRTFNSATFYGAGLLRRLRAEKEALGEKEADTTRAIALRRAGAYQRSSDTFRVSAEEAYGYRGDHPAVYYLSPWEFTSLW